MTSFEILATITGIIGVYFQAKEKIIAWPFVLISVSISSIIFFESKLYSDFGLHIIYIFLNMYGWYIWSNKTYKSIVTPTKLLPLNGLIATFLGTVGFTLILGYLMHTYTDADLPYFDAFTTSGSLIAQYLLAKKYLQNWWLWIIVDIVAIPMYLYKGLYIIAGLFAVYLILSIYGYLEWKKAVNKTDLSFKNKL
ncbi:MAG: nicotinamide riboside transporter PnuC [Saprospiraceae bacterium]